MIRTTAYRRSRLLAAAAVLPLLAGLAACSSAAADADKGSSDLQTNNAKAGLSVDTDAAQKDRPHTTQDPAAIALLPASFKDKDTLAVAVSAYVAPLAFLADDDKTPIGNEPDIAQLVADALGKKLDLEVTAWEDWPLALSSGKVDAVISNVTVTEERKETIDFSSYRNDQLGWLAKVGNSKVPASITKPADVAGLTVAVGSGTNQEKILLAWDKQNRAAGLKPVDIQYFQNDPDTILALQSGRIDLSFGPNATAAYKAKTDPTLHVVGTLNGGWPDTAQIAVGTKKGNELAPAITEALNHAIADGSYAKVLDRWGLTAEAIAKSETNPHGLPKS